MFDVSLAEVLVLVTGAGMLLGRKEITLMARSLGRGLGRVVGTLQGLRVKYEEKSQGSQLYQLHKNVKDGLTDMGTIGADLNSLSSSPHSRYASMAAAAAGASTPDGLSNRTWAQTQSQSSAAVSSSTPQESLSRKSGGILGSNNRKATSSAATAAAATTTAAAITAAASPHVSPAQQTFNAVDFRLAQLILADEELNKQRGPASLREYEFLGKDSLGVDLVESAICESIINAAREAHDAGRRP